MRWPRRRPRGVERARGARVAAGVVLDAAPGARIVLGPGAVLGERCRLQASAGATVRVDGILGAECRLLAREAVTVAAGARLGDRCALIDFEPIVDDVEQPIRRQGWRAAPIHIGAGALLGPGVAVLGGVSVGARATVLANSVVASDVPPDGRAAAAQAGSSVHVRDPPGQAPGPR